MHSGNSFSLINRKINRANRDALPKEMDLRDVVREIIELGDRVADGLAPVQNVRLEDAQLHFHVSRKRVAPETVIHYVRHAHQWSFGPGVPHQGLQSVSTVIAYKDPSVSVGTKNPLRDWITIGAKGSQPEVHHPFGHAAHAGRGRSESIEELS